MAGPGSTGPVQEEPSFDNLSVTPKAQPSVFLGAGRYSPYAGKALPGGKVPGSIPNVVGLDAAIQRFYSWDPGGKEIKAWRDLLIKSGIVKPEDANWNFLEKAWEDAAGEAAKLYSAGKNITPQKFVELYAGSNGLAATAGPKTTTSTNTVIPYSDPAATRDLIRTGVGKMLGRSPADDELDDMMHVARQYEASAGNRVTQTTQTTDGDSQSTTTKTLHGGPTGAGLKEKLTDAVRSKPEYASYQAATTYMNALMSAIQAPVQINAPG